MPNFEVSVNPNGKPELKIDPPDLSAQSLTYLSAAIAAAGTTATVENSTGFAYSDYCVFGKIGEEQTECIRVHASSGLTGTAIPLVTGGVTYAHAVGTKVMETQYNQIKIYRSTTETGTFTEVTGSPISIDWERLFSVFTDTAGSSSSWYKVTFYNSGATTESAVSDAISATGFKAKSLGLMIDRARKLTNQNTDDNYNDLAIAGLINDLHRELADERNWPFLETTSTASTTIAIQTYSLPSDYKHGSMRAVRITSGSVYYYPTYVPSSTFELLDRSVGLAATIPTRFAIWGTNYYLFPIPSATGTSDITLFYTKVPTTLSDQNDVSDFPDVSYFFYAVAEQIAVSLGQDAGRITWLNSQKDNAVNRLRRAYGKKQSREMGQIRDIGSELIINPNAFTVIG